MQRRKYSHGNLCTYTLKYLKFPISLNWVFSIFNYIYRAQSENPFRGQGKFAMNLLDSPSLVERSNPSGNQLQFEGDLFLPNTLSF
jgi:hypothetical protein